LSEPQQARTRHEIGNLPSTLPGGLCQTAPSRPAHALSEAESAGLPRGLLTLLLAISLMVVMAVSYVQSGRAVVLEVNGRAWRTRTHQQTVGALLGEVGLDLRPEDIVSPPLGTPLDGAQTIVVQKAMPVWVEADGQVTEHYTHSRTVEDLMRETGLQIRPHDAVMLDGEPVDVETPLPEHNWSPQRWPLLEKLAPGLVSAAAPSWSRLKLQRAIPLSISDSGAELTTYTLARTVGEALLSQDIVLYLGDRVWPMLGTLLTTGMHVEIQRATPVTIQADGKLIKTRVQAHNVAQLLNEAGIQLLGKDYTAPSLDTAIVPDMSVQVVRVIEAWLVESEDISFETVYRPDGTLELDQYRTDQPGSLGVRKRRVRLVYEDGQETQRMVADEWVERQPTTRFISYGTKIVVRELETPGGVVRYWRKVRMLATSYNAPTAGKSADHPQYGITRLGLRARKGIVAVDPGVVALRTEVYVPGYGLGTAADTGGAIQGRRIDLCYDDDNLVLWYKWVDVYLLEPVPPADEITWMLPNYPRERR
jgi:uncharacterized protein YabE (DUF348 family)